jgi:hypothetical protein
VAKVEDIPKALLEEKGGLDSALHLCVLCDSAVLLLVKNLLNAEDAETQ